MNRSDSGAAGDGSVVCPGSAIPNDNARAAGRTSAESCIGATDGAEIGTSGTGRLSDLSACAAGARSADIVGAIGNDAAWSNPAATGDSTIAVPTIVNSNRPGQPRGPRRTALMIATIRR